MFSAEGGTLAFLRVDCANPSSVAFPPSQRLPFDGLPNAPGQVKRVTVGSLGVVAADLELDPALDIDDEVAGVGDCSPGSTPHAQDDRLDIIYVAGGHQGLWAIEAHPTLGYQNVAVRIDNSGNLNHLTQVSRRFCTDVETVQIGGAWFLLALFARKDQNLLRIYPLEEIHSIMDAARASTSSPPDLGLETVGARSIYFKDHPFQGPDVVVGGENLTYGGAYAMSMAIDEDPDESDGVGDPLFGDPVDVYVAALAGGLFRTTRAASVRAPIASVN